MAKIDLFDPKWIEMVFAGKNQEYGAYQLRKGTSRRNIVSLLILTAAVFLIGGYLAWKVIEEQRAKELAAYNAQIELSKLEEAAKKERKRGAACQGTCSLQCTDRALEIGRSR